MPKREKAKKKPVAKKTHTHIIGSSGSGKKKALSTMLHDPQHAGKAVTIIDPQGDMLPSNSKPKPKN